ncbi:hypothetical protein M9H77_24155 [Catharanthus roseus]|uniref:Uncharacterized protein n=1 Tax=Catharanthus roseus TaxID=4058 RepID=A0ACC0AXX8_CATRO|nr:hypothetical protein M9H77_24155 [Catharanthus roseus]
MVKPMRSLTIGSVETSSVETTKMDVTTVVFIPKETTPLSTVQAPIEEPLATPKVPKSADDMQFGRIGASDWMMHCGPLNVNPISLSDAPSKPVVRSSDTHFEHSRMISNEGHGRKNTKSRESARLKELIGSSKKPRLLKDDFGPILAKYAKNNRFYDSSCVKKFDLLKSREFVVETTFLEKIFSDNIVISELGEKTFSRKLDIDSKKSVESKAKKPPVRASKIKSAQAVIAPIVEDKFYIERTRFQEL